MVEVRPIQFHAGTAGRLAGVLYLPERPTASPVLIAPALGTPQRFYAHFASWLAARGQMVMSFDPSGVGESLALGGGRLRDVKADLLSWARVDFAAALGELCTQSGANQVRLLGHSLGVHHAAMTSPEAQRRIQHVVSVAAGSGYWRDWARPSRRVAPLMLHLAIPALTPWLGYFPGRRLGMVGDLPAGVARQWSGWCRHPDFAWGKEPESLRPSLDGAGFSIQALSFSDDEAMTERCTRQLLQAMPNAPSELHVVRPAEVGMNAIGHLGAFRRAAERQLWPLMERLLHSV